MARQLTNQECDQIGLQVYQDHSAPFFQTAYRDYPEYNYGGEDTERATDWIVAKLMDIVDQLHPDLDTDDWTQIHMGVYESVYEGLT